MEGKISIFVLSLISTYGLIVVHLAVNLKWKRWPSIELSRPRFADSFARTFDVTEQMQALYQKRSKLSLPFHLPSLFCPDIFVGLSERKVLDVRSQHELSVDEAHFDLLASDYTFLTDKTRHPKVHQDTIKLLLRPRKALESWIPVVGQEVALAFDYASTSDPSTGKSPQYERSDVHALLKDVVARAANRVICGKELCHNETFVKNSLAFITMVPYASSIIRLLVGRICSLPSRYFHAKSAVHSIPIIEQHIETAGGMKQERLHSDVLQALVYRAIEDPDPAEGTPRQISIRLLVLTFATIFPAFSMVWNTVLDLVSAPQEARFIEGIREEIARVKGHGQPLSSWTLSELDSLWRLDSALKESMRRWSPLQFAATRAVTSSSGFKLSDGTTVGKGATIGLPMHAIHHDPEFYPNPETYDAFRFAELREQADGPEQRRHQLTSTSSAQYVGFGLPLNACPGRHFAAILMKLVLIHLLTNFNLESLEERPQPLYLGGVVLPPGAVPIGIRQRK
ncbi:MAG: hypothetical protein M1822_004832 [Bathelium mastoideum]|nr:MAG: hypothetical protein M1822_004832 [Bathelium mastoideum]